jgi:tetratricopeptide (TPR) repeat protein
MSADREREANYWIDKGCLLDNEGKYEEAISCFDKAIAINPQSATAWYNKGGILGFRFSKLQEEIACLDKALEINPQYKEAWNNKAAALHRLSRHQEALKCLEEALRIDPEYPNALFLKDSILFFSEGKGQKKWWQFWRPE